MVTGYSSKEDYLWLYCISDQTTIVKIPWVPLLWTTLKGNGKQILSSKKLYFFQETKLFSKDRYHLWRRI